MKKKMSTRQKIDASHEARMWLNQVIIPGVTSLVIIDRVNPGLKYKVCDWVKEKSNSIREKFHINKNVES